MDLLHFVLLALLGFLTFSTAMVPARPMTGVAARDIEQGLHHFEQGHHHTAGKEVEDRPGTTVNSVLVKFELMCGLDPKTPSAPFSPGWQLQDRYCKQWFACASDGTKAQIKEVPEGEPNWLRKRRRLEWCRDWCECVQVDDPAEHFAWNMGCVDPYGDLVAGHYGSVARDLDSAEPLNDDHGLVMEACDGPPREE